MPGHPLPVDQEHDHDRRVQPHQRRQVDKVLGTALGVGILIDATLVRALLVPALVSLLGRWNWWLPSALAKLLRVEPSAVAPAGSEPGLPTRQLTAV